MTRIGRLLRDALRTPSGFETRPWAYLANQAGHMLAVGMLGAALLPWWLVIAVYAAWEAVQIARFGAEPWDALEDLGFVVAGVAAVAGSLWVMAPAALFLAAGALRRT